MNTPSFETIKERAELILTRVHQLIKEEIAPMKILVPGPASVGDIKTEADVAKAKLLDNEEWRMLRDVEGAAWSACDDLRKIVERIPDKKKVKAHA